MPELDSTRVQDILAEASALEVELRDAYLDNACKDDSALRAEVNELLAAQREAGRFLTAPAVELPRDPGAPSRLIGTQVGRFKILEVVGEGGFAVIYRAHQTEPIKREVAIKILKLGMDTRQVIARFEAERQALAILSHPNIAKVFDAGTTET